MSKVYEIITDKIIQALENGTVPWRMPWTVRHPQNFVSKRPYSGVNTLLLRLAGRSTPYWLSYNQAYNLGGHVKKGEKGTVIIFTRNVRSKDEETDEEKSYRFLTTWTVFNLDQTEGIEIPKDGIDFKPIEQAEKIVSGYWKKPFTLTDRAAYSPALDEILMPPKESFENEPKYYSTLFHEMVHSTGHQSRLNRFEADSPLAAFGSESYSKEELVAEIGSSFLLGEAGIDGTMEHNAAYIAGWLKKLNDDKKLIISAAAQASKGADLIMGRE